VPEGRVNTGHHDDGAASQYSRKIISGMLRATRVITVTAVEVGESVADAGGTGRSLFRLQVVGHEG
jgi:hypothetical protein